jgi:hypothetical protein
MLAYLFYSRKYFSIERIVSSCCLIIFLIYEWLFIKMETIIYKYYYVFENHIFVCIIYLHTADAVSETICKAVYGIRSLYE